jgi:PIN domain nuclease of toxin-antitoxin system
MILLDTNALIWLEQGHARAKKLAAVRQRLYISPVSVLELQFLVEAGRVRVRGSGGVADVIEQGPWLLDDPPAAAWFDAALGLGWTRDPFDRLLVAHAQLRGWRLATGDTALLARLPERGRLEV